MEGLGKILLQQATFWGLCILVFGGLERLFPRYPSQTVWRWESSENIGWHFINKVIQNAWLLPFLGVVFLQVAGIGEAFRSRIPALEEFAHGPAWLKFVVLFFLMDFLGWFIHFLMHEFRFLTRFHVLHHSSERLDWLATFRSHWVEILLLDFGKAVPLLILPQSDPVYVFLLHFAPLWTFFLHSNSRIGPRTDRPLGRQLFGWIGSPVYHHWHHSVTNVLEKGQNFGGFTLVWDRLFGTLYLPQDGKPPKKLGIPRQEKYPSSLLSRLLGPFLPGAHELR